MGKHQLILGDCLEAMAELPACSVDAVVCDPPYGLGFMGKAWDSFTEGGQALAQTGRGRGKARGGDGSPSPSMCAGSYDRSHRANRAFGVWCQSWAVEAFRILKPGGHLVSFSSTRTAHRMATGIEDAGFDIRDTISWLYWSGFPKSFDVSKAIDKHGGKDVSWFGPWLRTWRTQRGITQKEIAALFPSKSGQLTGCVANWELGLNLPTAAQFSRICSAFDLPFNSIEAAEREILGRHPGDMGGLGGDRLGLAGGDITAPATDEAKTWDGWGTALKPAQEPAILARKPLEGTVAANVLKWGTGGLNIDGCRYAPGDGAWPGPDNGSDVPAVFSGDFGNNGIYGGGTRKVQCGGHDLGRWPANIFQCAKPARSEREAGCAHLPSSTGIHNIHPTVKPIQIMAWLCRLVTPPGGVVLDPFMGSGTTGIAALRQGFDFIGIEREARYLEIARARIEEDAPLFNRVQAV